MKTKSERRRNLKRTGIAESIVSAILADRNLSVEILCLTEAEAKDVFKRVERLMVQQEILNRLRG